MIELVVAMGALFATFMTAISIPSYDVSQPVSEATRITVEKVTESGRFVAAVVADPVIPKFAVRVTAGTGREAQHIEIDSVANPDLIGVTIDEARRMIVVYDLMGIVRTLRARLEAGGNCAAGCWPNTTAVIGLLQTLAASNEVPGLLLRDVRDQPR